jgi:hypothetical protein
MVARNSAVAATRRSRTSSGVSSTMRSSGTTLNSGCPFLMITPSPATSTFSMVPLNGA